MNMKGWKKLEDDKGFPYYYNENTKSKQPDHPHFKEIKQKLENCNYIKHAVYRVASKFRVLQQSLYMDSVSLTTIIGVFEKHKLGPTESCLNLDVYDLEAILSDIYFATNKQNQINIDIDLAVDLMINLLYNIYDNKREANIPVFCTKLVLALLSCCKLTELYNFLFVQCSDHNHCITRLRLHSLLSKIVDVLVYLHEDASYGSYLINSTVESCFSKCPGLIGINQSSFIEWLEGGPQLCSWLLTLYRLKISEGVIHLVKCSFCKIYPITGLQYKCTKCLNIKLCQICFFHGKVIGSHKTSHPMREYCVEGKGKEFYRSIFKNVFKILRCSSKNSNRIPDFEEAKVSVSNSKNLMINDTNNSDTSCSENNGDSPEKILMLIIKQLEIQNSELKNILIKNTHQDNNLKIYLEQHRSLIATQIQKLKHLQENLKSIETNNYSGACLIQSTPFVANNKNSKKPDNIGLLSPIAQMPELETFSEHSNDKTPREKINFESTNENSPRQDSIDEEYSIKDISTWLKESHFSRNSSKNISNESNNDLDDVLVKLQQILANNFILDEDLDKTDNDQLQNAVTEVETMLSSLRQGVETKKQ